MSRDQLLKAVLGTEIFEGLNKALQKLSTRSVVDIQELHAAMKTVPKAVMAFLIRELKPMEKGENKQIKLPYHDNAIMLVNKHDGDVYDGNIAQDGKIVHEFSLASLPQLAVHLVSNYELYDMKQPDAEAKKPGEEGYTEDFSNRVNERMENEKLKDDLLSEKIKTLEAKIDQVMVLVASQKPSAAMEKSERSAEAAKVLKILTSRNLRKDGLMPKMPKPPGAGVKVGGNQGITMGGLHGDKTAHTDLNAHPVQHRNDPYLKVPKNNGGQPKQPKQPKTSFATKSEGTIGCSDCGEKLVKSGTYVGCSCFKGMSQPSLKKNENGSTTFTFDGDWDEDARFALWRALRNNDG